MNKPSKSIELSIGDLIVLGPLGPLIYASLMVTLIHRMTRSWTALATTNLSNFLEIGAQQNPTDMPTRFSYSGLDGTQEGRQIGLSGDTFKEWNDY